MQTTLKINTTGARKKLAEFQRKVDSLPWRQAGEIVKQSIQLSFDTGGAYKSERSIMGGTQKWKPRKKTVAWKILRKTGALQRSIYVSSALDSVTIGSRGLPYNRAHNLGYSAKNIPARPFLVIQPGDLAKIKILFKKHLSIK